MKRVKVTTTTTLVLEALHRADDFMTASQLQAVTGRAANQVFAALHHLRNHHAVQSIESDGALWWYHTEEDSRSRVIEEKAQEIKPRKQRKPRAKKVAS